MTLIVEFFNTCFTKNKAQSRDGKHAVTFVECQEIAKRVLASNKVARRFGTSVVGGICTIFESSLSFSSDYVLQ